MFERLLTSFQNILKIPELRTRILFTLGMLVVYRVGAHIPTPGHQWRSALRVSYRKQGGALLGFLDIFSGGSLSRLTIFALGIMPYISASIILQLLTVVVPHLSKLAKEGERGRKKIIQYTRFGTIGIALIQGFGIAVGLEQMNSGAFVLSRGWAFRLMTVITLDGRHRLPDVAGRADYRARHRERHFAHYFRRDRRALALRRGPDL